MNSYSKRFLLAVAVATLGSGAVMTASAQSTSSAPAATPPGGRHHPHFRGPGSPLLGTVLRAVHQLNLPANETTEIQSLIKAARQADKPGSGTPEQPLDIASLLTDPSSAGTIEQNIATQAQTRTLARSTQEIELIQSIYNYVNGVNPTQGAALVAAVEKIQAQEQARRAQWQAKHG